MIIAWLVACTTPSDAGSPPIPEATAPMTPSSPEANPEPAAAGAATAFTEVPAKISAIYDLTLGEDGSFTANPARVATRRSARSAGFEAKDTPEGGKSITLEGGPIASAEWKRARLDSLVTEAEQLEKLQAAGYPTARERDVLVVQAKGDEGPTYFAFSYDPNKRGLVGVCSEVTVLDFGVKRPQVTVRKPVVYVYPDRPRRVRVAIDLRGEFTARYPAMEHGAWEVLAHPDGTLVDRSGREHRYLFWEGTGVDFRIDPAEAVGVPGSESAAFLESVCDAYALTPAECGDFVTYWLPEMKRNAFNVVAFPDSLYQAYAPMRVQPEPDTLIRLFMVFEGHDSPVWTGNPALPSYDRKGFTVVEWGGAAL